MNTSCVVLLSFHKNSKRYSVKPNYLFISQILTKKDPSTTLQTNAQYNEITNKFYERASKINHPQPAVVLVRSQI